MEEGFESSNFNSKWMDNIYENIKNSEFMVRMAREGCTTILEYIQMPPHQREIVVGDVQYKNLRLLIGELNLLLTDLQPIIKEEESKKYFEVLGSLDKIKNNRKLFVKDIYSASQSRIISSKITPFFLEVLKGVEEVRKKMILEIAPVLYLKTEDKKKW